MNEKIDKMRKDYEGAKVDSIGVGHIGCFHFIFKKGKKYFGIKVHPSDFTTMEYKEDLKGKGKLKDD